MEIDWFTVGAQLVNFLILFWLLSRFLYRPIVDAVETRRAKIAGRLEEAESREQQAQAAKREYEQQQRELADQRTEILEEAEDEAEQKYDEMVEGIRHEVERLREQWFERLNAEKRRHLEDFSNDLEAEIFRVTEEAFRDLADREIEAQIVETFIDKLEAIAGEHRESEHQDGVIDEMNRELGDAGGDVSVRTSFSVSEEQRHRIADAIARHLSGQVQPEFEVDDRLVAGIELRVGARRFGWNLRAYLESLRSELGGEDPPVTGFESERTTAFRPEETTG